MRTILHILTRSEDDLWREMIARQQGMTETKVQIVNLVDVTPDYDELLEKIFAADSIEVF